MVLCSIATQQLVMYTDWLTAVDISLVETQNEGQSENENQETIKDKNKIDYISLDIAAFGLYDLLLRTGNGATALLNQKPYFEIHSPPPE